MASVVFMRGVNVGGHRAFRPAVLAKELSALQVVSIGAAGTFVVRKTVAPATLRRELLRRLPFEPEIMICRARDVADLVATDPFPKVAGEVRRFVSVIVRRPRVVPHFPIDHPVSGPWQVRLVGLQRLFVLSLHRRVGKRRVYPNEIVEGELAVSATTRSWDTILRIDAVARESRPAGRGGDGGGGT